MPVIWVSDSVCIKIIVVLPQQGIPAAIASFAIAKNRHVAVSEGREADVC